MFVNLKSALIYCHKYLVKSGHYHFAHSLLQFLNGNDLYCCAAVQVLLIMSEELINEGLI